ncbi:MAG: nucleotide pyrophosphohydrolase [Candidatus Micrarchaeia archaeon]|jgi:NTP pyrophosphatase (non-canonical NTP hydrolase)
MDSKTDIAQLKKRVQKFCEERDWDQYHNAKDLAIGVSTEAAELLEHFRFKSEKEIEEMFKDAKKKGEITEEVADVFYFLLRLSQKYDIDLSDALENKILKNEKKYPIEKAKGSNKKYNEF